MCYELKVSLDGIVGDSERMWEAVIQIALQLGCIYTMLRYGYGVPLLPAGRTTPSAAVCHYTIHANINTVELAHDYSTATEATAILFTLAATEIDDRLPDYVGFIVRTRVTGYYAVGVSSAYTARNAHLSGACVA